MRPGVDYGEGQDLFMKVRSLGVESVDRDRLVALAEKWHVSGAYFCPTLYVFESDAAGEAPEEFMRARKGSLAAGRLFVREFSARGIRLLVGQDGEPTPEGTLDEMEALSRAGVPNAEILRAATLYPAQWLGIGDNLGTLAPGRIADILILTANPLERIENARTVWRIVYNGKLLDDTDR
jgi:imidazolonepropionase-like amidohydrolase